MGRVTYIDDSYAPSPARLAGHLEPPGFAELQVVQVVVDLAVPLPVKFDVHARALGHDAIERVAFRVRHDAECLDVRAPLEVPLRLQGSTIGTAHAILDERRLDDEIRLEDMRPAAVVDALADERPILGDSNNLTLRMRCNYAAALHNDEGATLDDLREAITTLEDVAPTARRVLGGANPLTRSIEQNLRATRAALRARETPPTSNNA